MKRFLLLFGLLFLTLPVFAQEIDKSRIVHRLADLMSRNYVYAEKGYAMHDLILGKLGKNEYNQYSTNEDFAAALEADLKSVINDKHIRVSYDPERAEVLRGNDRNGGREHLTNYGFREVSILKHNVGYLDLRGFEDIRFAEEAAKKAMDKLIHTNAIIFDLRKNGGGSPSMIRFISSYIFGDEPVHLNSFYWRPDDNYSESWTNPDFTSYRRPDIPVYVLTSDYTFSAAEEFTYNLKHLKRATIIGEITGGGAHPGGPMIIRDGFIVNVPQGRAINPVTGTNWEGVGVIPHIELAEEQALNKATELIRKKIVKYR